MHGTWEHKEILADEHNCNRHIGSHYQAQEHMAGLAVSTLLADQELCHVNLEL